MFQGILEPITYSIGKLPLFIPGTLLTIELTIIAMVAGTAIGIVFALLKISHNKLLNLIGSFYTWVFRGMPLLVQIYIIYFGLPGIGIEIDPFPTAVLALSLCAGAYITEIIRAGIQSIDRGQMEAALSLGMSYGQAMRRIIIPQTYRRLVPPMANEFITLMKDTSLVSITTLVEILRTAVQISAAQFRPFEMFLTAGIIYLALTTVATYVTGWCERKLAQQE